MGVGVGREFKATSYYLKTKHIGAEEVGLRKKKKKKGKEKKEGKRKVLCSTEGSDILRISKPSNKRERKEIKIRERLLRDSGRDLFKGILRN